MTASLFLRERLAIFLLLAGCSVGGGDAQRLGTAFCAAVVAHDESAATALMTPAVQAQIRSLRAFDADFRRQRPGDKPPLGDGLRLTAFPDAVTGCRVTTENPLQIVLHYAPAGAPNDGWRDRLLLVKSADGRLQIGDIAFGSDNRVRLRGWLAESMVG
ncbi:MAG: hypothetical protein ACOYLS_07845 [Polymorphobacter sp.]